MQVWRHCPGRNETSFPTFTFSPHSLRLPSFRHQRNTGAGYNVFFHTRCGSPSTLAAEIAWLKGTPHTFHGFQKPSRKRSRATPNARRASEHTALGFGWPFTMHGVGATVRLNTPEVHVVRHDVAALVRCCERVKGRDDERAGPTWSDRLEELQRTIGEER